jgi:uncharacterized protein YjiS (DUF1127 family)
MPHIALALVEPGRRLAVLGARARRLSRKVAVALMVRAERRALMRLDDVTLKDMGFNKGQAECEASRSFWDVPLDRLRL